MAGKFVLVICPDMNGKAEVDAFNVVMNDVAREGDFLFTFNASIFRRALEEIAIKKKFPDLVRFTVPDDPPLQELVALARQYDRLPPIKRVENSEATRGESDAEQAA